MCLLFTGQSNTVRSTFLTTAGLIESMFDQSPDGLGFMFADAGQLVIHKELPQSVADVRRMFEALPDDDRLLAGHARMRTHGDINLDSCHPYVIYEGHALMHNGVLSTGNRKDKTKSDTWHFIEDHLKLCSADSLHDRGVAAMLGRWIGGNRFAIMSADGRLTVVNEHQGVEAAGVWFSNTYAWDPALLIPSYKSYTKYGGYMLEDEEDSVGQTAHAGGAWRTGALRSTHQGGRFDELALDVALEQNEPDELAEILYLHPRSAVEYLLDVYDWERYRTINSSDLTRRDRAWTEKMIRGRKADIINGLRSNVNASTNLAEALVYYMEWTPKKAVAFTPDTEAVESDWDDVGSEFDKPTLSLVR